MDFTSESYLKKENYFIKYFFMGLKSILYAIFITIVFALIIGFRPVIIAGGSMLPTLERGDIIIIKKPAKEQIKVGDILTFRLSEDGSYCTHRIIEIDEMGNFYTQGDNPNNSPDGYPISYAQVVGITIYKFHYIPCILYYLLNIPNLIFVISAIILLYQSNRESKYICNKLKKYL